MYNQRLFQCSAKLCYDLNILNVISSFHWRKSIEIKPHTLAFQIPLPSTHLFEYIFGFLLFPLQHSLVKPHCKQVWLILYILFLFLNSTLCRHLLKLCIRFGSNTYAKQVWFALWSCWFLCCCFFFCVCPSVRVGE